MFPYTVEPETAVRSQTFLNTNAQGTERRGRNIFRSERKSPIYRAITKAKKETKKPDLFEKESLLLRLKACVTSGSNNIV